jgi:tRNA threonylcarbamoyladenosine biosynthesis protein TsaE
MKETVLKSRSLSDTMKLGRAIGRLAGPGDVIALYGELGAGKTHLTKGIAAGAGYRESRNVTSPSFILVNEYRGRVPIYHVDAYRLKGRCDASSPDPGSCDLGWDEFFHSDAICIVEWADRVTDLLPAERLDVLMEHESPTRRRITLTPHGARYEGLIKKLRGREGKRQKRNAKRYSAKQRFAAKHERKASGKSRSGKTARN